MKRLAIVALLACGCSKPSPQGLPPAQDWGSSSAQGSNALPPGHPEPLPPGHPDPLPPGHPDPATKTLTKLPDGRFALGPYSIAVPARWVEVPTKSEMRAAQFKIDDAELVVYYFGEDGAGTTKDNVDRWTSQFTRDDGKPLQPKIEQVKIVGLEATVVRVSGHFTAAAMPGAAAVDKADQSMLAAITQSPSGPYYWKLLGGNATMAARGKELESLWKGMTLR